MTALQAGLLVLDEDICNAGSFCITFDLIEVSTFDSDRHVFTYIYVCVMVRLIQILLL